MLIVASRHLAWPIVKNNSYNSIYLCTIVILYNFMSGAVQMCQLTIYVKLMYNNSFNNET